MGFRVNPNRNRPTNKPKNIEGDRHKLAFAYIDGFMHKPDERLNVTVTNIGDGFAEVETSYGIKGKITFLYRAEVPDFAVGDTVLAKIGSISQLADKSFFFELNLVSSETRRDRSVAPPPSIEKIKPPSSIETGDTFDGRVVNIHSEHGALIEISPGITGLLPIHPEKIIEDNTTKEFSVGDTIKVKVWRIRKRADGKTEIALFRPIDNIKAGEIINAKVIKYEPDLGVFMDIGAGNNGLWRDPSFVCVKNQRILVKIKWVNRTKEQFTLKLAVEVGKEYSGEVINIDPRFGAFVELGAEANARVLHIPDWLKPGQKVDVVIREIKNHHKKGTLIEAALTDRCLKENRPKPVEVMVPGENYEIVQGQIAEVSATDHISYKIAIDGKTSFKRIRPAPDIDRYYRGENNITLEPYVLPQQLTLGQPLTEGSEVSLEYIEKIGGSRIYTQAGFSYFTTYLHHLVTEETRLKVGRVQILKKYPYRTALLLTEAHVEKKRDYSFSANGVVLVENEKVAEISQWAKTGHLHFQLKSEQELPDQMYGASFIKQLAEKPLTAVI